MQPDLFSRQRRDLGIHRARTRADADTPNWSERAAAYLAEFARKTALGQAFLIEDAVASCPLDLRPKEPRAWGGALRVAVQNGALRKARDADGRYRYGIGRVNCSPKIFWEAT